MNKLTKAQEKRFVYRFGKKWKVLNEKDRQIIYGFVADELARQEEEISTKWFKAWKKDLKRQREEIIEKLEKMKGGDTKYDYEFNKHGFEIKTLDQAIKTIKEMKCKDLKSH